MCFNGRYRFQVVCVILVMVCKGFGTLVIIFVFFESSTNCNVPLFKIRGFAWCFSFLSLYCGHHELHKEMLVSELLRPVWCPSVCVYVGFWQWHRGAGVYLWQKHEMLTGRDVVSWCFTLAFILSSLLFMHQGLWPSVAEISIWKRTNWSAGPHTVKGVNQIRKYVSWNRLHSHRMVGI